MRLFFGLGQTHRLTVKIQRTVDMDGPVRTKKQKENSSSMLHSRSPRAKFSAQGSQNLQRCSLHKTQFKVHATPISVNGILDSHFNVSVLAAGIPSGPMTHIRSSLAVLCQVMYCKRPEKDETNHFKRRTARSFGGWRTEQDPQSKTLLRCIWDRKDCLW